MDHYFDALPLFNIKTTEKTTMNDQTPSPFGGLNSMQHDALSRYLTALENLGVSYSIMLPDGSERKHGTYAMPAKERRQRTAEYRFGELKAHYISHVESLGIGGYVMIPRGHLPAEAVRGSLCGWATRTWGPKTYTTAITADGENIEVMRHGGL